MRRTSYRSESSIPAAAAETRLRESPEPINPVEGETGGYSHPLHEQLKSHSTPATVKHSSNPIHHHIAPAFGAPFMKADGLVHRGILPSQPFCGWLLIVGHLVHRYTDGTESPVPVQLKSLGDGTVITRTTPTW